MNWRDIANPSAGGAELVTHEIARRWINWGNEVRLLTSTYPSARREENVEGLKVTRVGGKYSVYLASAYRFLKEYSHSYDIVIDQINSIPFLATLYSGVPVVPLIFQITGDIYYREMPRFISSIAVAVEPLLLKLYGGCQVIVLSNSTKEDLVSMGFFPDDIHICQPGVDHEEFVPGKKTPYPSILYLNRFARYKNPEHVLTSFRKVLDEVPNCKLTLAGARTRDDLDRLQKHTNELGLGDSTEILPFVRGKSKVELLKRSWIHVLPSMREGWGISILEAAACGTPTVGYDVSGVRDAVRHGETGLLVPYGNISSFTQAIQTLLGNDELRRSMSEESKRWASTFTWESTAVKAMRAMTTALNGHVDHPGHETMPDQEHS